MSNTVVLVADFQARPGQEKALRDALAALVAPSEAEAGCLGYRPLADPAKPGAMICLEEWCDEAALESHFRTPHFQNVARILDDVLATPFLLRRLTQAPEAV